MPGRGQAGSGNARSDDGGPRGTDLYLGHARGAAQRSGPTSPQPSERTIRTRVTLQGSDGGGAQGSVSRCRARNDARHRAAEGAAGRAAPLGPTRSSRSSESIKEEAPAYGE